MAADNDYQQAMTELQTEINKIEFGENQVARENWKELKKIGRT